MVSLFVACGLVWVAVVVCFGTCLLFNRLTAVFCGLLLVVGFGYCFDLLAGLFVVLVSAVFLWCLVWGCVVVF